MISLTFSQQCFKHITIVSLHVTCVTPTFKLFYCSTSLFLLWNKNDKWHIIGCWIGPTLMTMADVVLENQIWKKVWNCCMQKNSFSSNSNSKFLFPSPFIKRNLHKRILGVKVVSLNKFLTEQPSHPLGMWNVNCVLNKQKHQQLMDALFTTKARVKDWPTSPLKSNFYFYENGHHDGFAFCFSTQYGQWSDDLSFIVSLWEF